MIQGLVTNSSDSFLPDDNYPSWLVYKCEGPSVLFQVPEDSDCCMKGITLCVIYSSTPQNLTIECITSVIIVNYTKLTIQVYKHDTIMSFNDDDWRGVVSNLGIGDNVEIFVSIGNGLTVKEMAVYLIYGQSTAIEIESIPEVEVQSSPHEKTESSPEMEAQTSADVKIQPSITVEVELSTDVKMELIPEVEVQPSPHAKAESSAEMEAQTSLDVKIEPSITVEVEPSTDAKKEPLDEVEVQPSSNVKTDLSAEEEVNPSPDVKIEPSLVVKNEPLPKTNRKIFTRLAKRVGECLCLNQK